MDMNELNAILKLAGLQARPIDEPTAMEPDMAMEPGMEPAMSTGCGCDTGCGCGMTENEEEFANAPDGVHGKPSEVEVGDETVDLSLRRHIGADAAPVKVQEMVEAYRSFKETQLDEHCGTCGVGEAEENEASESLIEEVDEDSVRELVLYAENDGTLYQQSTAPIQKNLSKKWVKGIYDHDKAIQLWKYHADRAAKAYGREFSNNDGLKIFNPAVRKAAAEEFANDWKGELEAGNLHETAMVEAVGDAAEEFYRLYSEFAGDEPSGAAGTIIGELVRYLSADDLSDFVETFRSNYDMDDYDAMESAMLSVEEAEAELATISEDPSKPSFPIDVPLAGDSIWDKDGTNPESVTVTDYTFNEDEEGYVSVTVMHNGPWTIYTDTGFEQAISNMLGMDVEFSEQGMQDDGAAHLEGEAELGEALDPVGKEDGDIDNDGDKDSSDEYLKKRRDAIDSAINESRFWEFDAGTYAVGGNLSHNDKIDYNLSPEDAEILTKFIKQADSDETRKKVWNTFWNSNETGDTAQGPVNAIAYAKKTLGINEWGGDEPKFDDMDKKTLDKEFDDEEPMFKDMDKKTLDMEEDAELARLIELAGLEMPVTEDDMDDDDSDTDPREFALNAVEVAKDIQKDNYYFSDSSYYEFTDGFDTDDDDFMDDDLVQQVMRALPNVDMDEDEIKQAVDALAAMDTSNIVGEGKYGKKKATEEAKPDFLDLDGDGNKDEDMADAAKDKEEKVNEDHDKYDDAQELYNENGVKVMAYNFAGDSSQFEIYINDEALVDGIKVGEVFHVEGKEYTEVADLVDDYSSLEEGQNYEIKDGEVHISRSDFRRVHKDFKNDEAGNERMSALDPDSGATTSYPVRFAG